MLKSVIDNLDQIGLTDLQLTVVIAEFKNQSLLSQQALDLLRQVLDLNCGYLGTEWCDRARVILSKV